MNLDKIKSLLDGEIDEKNIRLENLNELVITLTGENAIELLEKLEVEPYNFNFLTNLTAVDYEENFTVIYNLRSTVHNVLLTVRVELDKDEPSMPTATNIWKAANWQEREVFDLMGIVFTGHPKLNRILLPDDFQGYPLRKDYKLQTRR